MIKMQFPNCKISNIQQLMYATIIKNYDAKCHILKRGRFLDENIIDDCEDNLDIKLQKFSSISLIFIKEISK